MIREWIKSRSSQLAQSLTQPSRAAGGMDMLQRAIRDLADAVGLDSSLGWVPLLNATRSLRVDLATVIEQRNNLARDLTKAREACRQLDEQLASAQNASANARDMQHAAEVETNRLGEVHRLIVKERDDAFADAGAARGERDAADAEVARLTRELLVAEQALAKRPPEIRREPVPEGYELIHSASFASAKQHAQAIEAERDRLAQERHRLNAELESAQLRERLRRADYEKLRDRIIAAKSALDGDACDGDDGDRPW